MNEFLREVEEDIRKARLERLWKRVGKFAIAASALVILSTIAYVVWDHQKTTAAMHKTEQLMQAIDKTNAAKYDEAIVLFDALTQNPSSSYYAIAMLYKAQAQKNAGDEAAAEATYQALAKQSGGDYLAGIAQLAAAKHADAAQEIAKDAPFYHTQQEWRGWALLETKNYPLARSVFASLRDDVATPPAIRERADQALSLPELQEASHAQ